MITRRGFISMLTIGAGVVLVPNRKFFLPPRPKGFFTTTTIVYCPLDLPQFTRIAVWLDKEGQCVHIARSYTVIEEAAEDLTDYDALVARRFFNV